MSKSSDPSASSSLESIVPSLSEPEVGSDKKTDKQPEPASVREAPQVPRRAPGKIPKWLKLPGTMKSEESSSHFEFPRKVGSSVPNLLDVDNILEDVNIRLAGRLMLVNHRSVCDLNLSLEVFECRLWAVLSLSNPYACSILNYVLGLVF